jgi:hypothetical protein
LSLPHRGSEPDHYSTGAPNKRVVLGQFGDFETAFYHSAVNFTSLGCGDIVMDEHWRLLGALEAAIGLLMFGLTAGTVLPAMTRLFSRYRAMTENLKRPDP